MDRGAKQKNSLPPNTPQAIPADVAERLRRSGISLPGAPKQPALTKTAPPIKAAKLPTRPTSSKPTVSNAKKAIGESARTQDKTALKDTGANEESKQLRPPARSQTDTAAAKAKANLPELPARNATILKEEAIGIIQDVVLAKNFNFTKPAAEEAYKFWHTLANEQRYTLNVNDYYDLGKKFFVPDVPGVVALGKAIIFALETGYQNKITQQAKSETASKIPTKSV